jgi:ABC-type transporter Mla MlaB component
MIRVTRTEEPSKTVLTIDGQLTGDFVALVEASCNQAASDGKPVQVFLRDVPTVDQAGRKLLARLAARGMGLVACGVYTSYLVESLGASAAPWNGGNATPSRLAGAPGRTA